jgi:hypothetical protein
MNEENRRRSAEREAQKRKYEAFAGAAEEQARQAAAAERAEAERLARVKEGEVGGAGGKGDTNNEDEENGNDDDYDFAPTGNKSHSLPPHSAQYAGDELSSLGSGGVSAHVSPRKARGASRAPPGKNAGVAFHAAAAALAAAGWDEQPAEGNNIDIDNLNKDGNDAFTDFVKESDLSEFLDLFNNDYSTYVPEGAGGAEAGAEGIVRAGAEAEDAQIKRIGSLVIDHEDDVAFLAGFYLPSAISAASAARGSGAASAARGSGAASAASSSSALSISSSVSNLEQQLYTDRVKPHITQIIHKVYTLIQKKNPAKPP